MDRALKVVIIKNTGLEAFYFFLLLTVWACVRKSTCFAYFLIMWFKIRPIPRGEFGNVTKKFANRNLPFIYNKGKFDNKAKTIHCQTSVIMTMNKQQQWTPRPRSDQGLRWLGLHASFILLLYSTACSSLVRPKFKKESPSGLRKKVFTISSQFSE